MEENIYDLRMIAAFLRGVALMSDDKPLLKESMEKFDKKINEIANEIEAIHIK